MQKILVLYLYHEDLYTVLSREKKDSCTFLLYYYYKLESDLESELYNYENLNCLYNNTLYTVIDICKNGDVELEEVHDPMCFIKVVRYDEIEFV